MRQRHDGGFDVVISWTRLLGTARVTIHTQDQALADTVELGLRATGFVFVQLPLYRRFNGLQLAPHAIVSIGSSYRF